jgi:hypothetical protein
MRCGFQTASRPILLTLSRLQVFLTLHGGSGTDDQDFREAIAAGINIVPINTELRVAWRNGLEQGSKQRPDEVAPYKVPPPAVDSVRQVVASRLRQCVCHGPMIERAEHSLRTNSRQRFHNYVRDFLPSPCSYHLLGEFSIYLPCVVLTTLFRARLF